MSKFKYLAVMGLFALAAPASAANLIVNGGFETLSTPIPSGKGGYEIGVHYNYGQALTGWTSAPGSTTNANSSFNVLFDASKVLTSEPDTRYSASETQKLSQANFAGASPDGGNFVALDGDIFFNGALSQTVNGLTPGKTYALKFYWAGTQFENRTGDITERLDVSFGPSSFSTATVANPTHGFQGWFLVSKNFKAVSSSQLLSFLSVGTPDGLPPVALLDGVSLSTVPEPQSWALLIAGFGMVGVAARRRRLRVVAA